MPKLVYSPEGAEPKEWSFSFGRLLSPERIAIERLTGLGWTEVQRGFFGNQGAVVHALLWVMLKRDIPTLRAEEVVFCDDEIELDLTDEEAAEAIREMKASRGGLTDEQAEALAELEQRLAKPAEGDDPKED